MTPPSPESQLRDLERALTRALHGLRNTVASVELAMDDADRTIQDRWALLHRLHEETVSYLTTIVPLVDEVPMRFRSYPAYRDVMQVAMTLKRACYQAQELRTAIAHDLPR